MVSFLISNDIVQATLDKESLILILIIFMLFTLLGLSLGPSKVFKIYIVFSKAPELAKA